MVANIFALSSTATIDPPPEQQIPQIPDSRNVGESSFRGSSRTTEDLLYRTTRTIRASSHILYHH